MRRPPTRSTNRPPWRPGGEWLEARARDRGPWRLAGGRRWVSLHGRKTLGDGHFLVLIPFKKIGVIWSKVQGSNQSSYVHHGHTSSSNYGPGAHKTGVGMERLGLATVGGFACQDAEMYHANVNVLCLLVSLPTLSRT